MTTTPTFDQLKRAIVISEQIAALEAELSSLFNDSAPASAAKATPPQNDGRMGKRSAATIAKMKASQQARWAKVKSPSVAKAPAKKGQMSADGRARIVAAQKDRWAKIKGEKSPAAANTSAKPKAKLAAAAKRV